MLCYLHEQTPLLVELAVDRPAAHFRHHRILSNLKGRLMPREPQEVLDFIHAFWKENRFSPSVREIADHFRTSTSVINYYLLGLEFRLQLIQPRAKGMARNIVPVALAQAIEQFYIDETEDQA